MAGGGESARPELLSMSERRCSARSSALGSVEWKATESEVSCHVTSSAAWARAPPETFRRIVQATQHA